MPKPNKARQEAKQAAQKPVSGALDSTNLASGTILAAQIQSSGPLTLKLPAKYIKVLKEQYPGLEQKTETE